MSRKTAATSGRKQACADCAKRFVDDKRWEFVRLLSVHELLPLLGASLCRSIMLLNGTEILSQTVVRQPVGPVAAFTPWNFPANLPVRKLASALAAGCSIVIKPDERTPGTCMLVVKAFLDAGVPPDTINMGFGEPARVSEALIEHPSIAKVSVTGSVEVGKLLGSHAARHVKRFTGELGGHAPVIICDDGDLKFALKSSISAKFRNAGQVCASPIRFYVPRFHFESFASEFTRAARDLRLGAGLDQGTQMGPLTHARRIDEMERFVSDAVECGARLLTGGRRVDRRGYFFEPTVFADAPARKSGYEERAVRSDSHSRDPVQKPLPSLFLGSGP